MFGKASRNAIRNDSLPALFQKGECAFAVVLRNYDCAVFNLGVVDAKDVQAAVVGGPTKGESVGRSRHFVQMQPILKMAAADSF
jgi:hypothetical protein